MTIKELYQKSLDRGVIASDMTEDTFREKISTEEGLKSYYDFATQKKGLRFHPFDVFKERIGWNNEFSAAANAHVEQRNSIPSVEDSLPMQPMKLNPSVKDHPAPTNEQEYMQNLINQITSGEEQMPTSTTQPTKQEGDWADRFMDKWENVEQVPIVGELADMGKTAVAGVTAGTSRLIGGGTLNTAAMMMDNPIKVDAMGQPQYIPMGQTRKMNEIQAEQRLSYEDQLAAANRVAQAKKEGKEPDATDLRNSTFVRAANSVNDFADKMSKIARPADIAEDDTFIDLVSRGELINAAQLALGSTAESLPYMASNLVKTLQ